jgi:hypothetical protein
MESGHAEKKEAAGVAGHENWLGDHALKNEAAGVVGHESG